VISRIYIDNYKCFTNFEYRPGALQLLLGPNGTGKTAVFEVLEALRDFILDGAASMSAFPRRTLTAWDRRPEQAFELDLKGKGGEYSYRLVIEHGRPARRNRIIYEHLTFDKRVLYQFKDGEAHLFRGDGTAEPVDEFDASRSAISTIPDPSDNALLSWFRWRLSRVFVFYPDPVRMTSYSKQEQPHPDRGLHHLASWIRHLRLESPEISQRLVESLRQNVLDNLIAYRFPHQGDGTRLLKFAFGSPTSDNDRESDPFKLELGHLSTGQRALVALYTMLHAAVGPDMTLCIDEPDNYVALREIQPWLIELTDKVRDTGGQCLLISHHPELINDLAADCGMRFFRESGGPVRIQPFEWTEDGAIRPAEVVARGWENP
jgi:predicted ATPase